MREPKTFACNFIAARINSSRKRLPHMLNFPVGPYIRVVSLLFDGKMKCGEIVILLAVKDGMTPQEEDMEGFDSRLNPNPVSRFALLSETLPLKISTRQSHNLK